MIKKIDHLALAIRSIEASRKFFNSVLGLELEAIENVEDQGVKVGMLKVGDAYIELLEATSPESPVARFIEKRGEGFHHLTLEVDDIDAELGRLRTMGVKLIDERARLGARGSRIAFIHPQSTGGILIELCQQPMRVSREDGK
ncbi:MAG TPA: methylmalonyl-CoA epimerase [Acidobacteriota bacterium]